MTKSTLQN